MCVKEVIKALKNEAAPLHSSAQKIYQRYYEGMLNIAKHSSKVNLKNIPANSLCLHAVILTKDNYLLKAVRSTNSDYYPGRISYSVEEQLNWNDFMKEGFRVKNWAERLLEEELGITQENCGTNTICNAKILSIFLEEDALNMAMTAKIRLNLTRKQVEAILEDWPRKDYEFRHDFCTWKDIINDCDKICSGSSSQYHPTSVNRLFFVACSELRFDVAEKILDSCTVVP